MAVFYMNKVFQMPLRGHPKSVMLALANHANENGECWPSIKLLALECGITRQTVITHIKKLIARGLIKCVKQNDARGYRRNNYYTLNLDKDDFQSPNIQDQSQNSIHSKVKGFDGNIINPSIEPSLEHNKQQPKDCIVKQPKKKSARDIDIELPDWVPKEEWYAFIEMRKKIKSAMTHHAMQLAIQKLDELGQQGHSPEAVLNQSILNGWKGLFPITDSNKNFRGTNYENSAKPKSANRYLNAIREINSEQN